MKHSEKRIVRLLMSTTNKVVGEIDTYRIKICQDRSEGSAWWTPVCRKVETNYFRIFENFVGLNHFAGWTHQLLPFQAVHSGDVSRLRPLRPFFFALVSRGRSHSVKVVDDVGLDKKGRNFFIPNIM